MKLSKLVKMSFQDFILDCPVSSDRVCFEAGFHDSLLHSVITMREIGLNPLVIKKFIDTIDPQGQSFVYDLVAEEYDEYMYSITPDSPYEDSVRF
jgi:hypothetical protein